MIDDATVRDLIAWLRVQLGEDEQVARAAAPGPWRVEPYVYGPPEDGWGEPRRWEVLGPPAKYVVEYVVDQPYEGGGADKPDAEHIARYDPDHALAVVAAHRAILDGVERYLDPHPGRPCGPLDDDGELAWEGCELHQSATKPRIDPYAAQLLGVVYGDRDGYLEAWRPAAVTEATR